MEEYQAVASDESEEQDEQPLENLKHYYMKHALYQTMAATFLQGSWPVFPAPYWFEEYMYQAITLDEKAKVLTEIVYKTVDPGVLKQRYDEKDWDAYRQKYNKKNPELVEIPSVETYTTRKTGKIVRAIERAILDATKVPLASEEEEIELIKRMYNLKLHLANKPHLIAAALDTLLEDKEKPSSPSWKNFLYRANKHNIRNERDENIEVTNRSVINFGDESYYTAYTNNGFVCAISSGGSITETHLAAKLAATLLSKLQSGKDNYDQDIKDIVEQVELEIKDKVDELVDPEGVSLLAYRFFQDRIIGVNIGDSMLLVVNPNKQTTNQLFEARQYQDGDNILIPGNNVPKYDIKILDQKIFEPKSIFIALSGNVINELQTTDPQEEEREIFKYVKYSLTDEVLKEILGDNANQCANKLQEMCYVNNTTIVCMQKSDLVFIPAYKPENPLENEETAKRKARIKDYLEENFDLTGLSRSQAICVRRILEADFHDLRDYASHLTAEQNATPSNYQKAIAGALTIFSSEFTFTDKHGHTIFRRWVEQDATISKEDQSVTYDPQYNREFASRLIKCAHGLSKNNFREGVGNFGSNFSGIFSRDKSPKIDWDLAQLSVAGRLAKSLVSCKTLAMYEAWRDDASHIHDHLDQKSALYKVLTEIFRDLGKVVSVSPNEEKLDIDF